MTYQLDLLDALTEIELNAAYSGWHVDEYADLYWETL